MPLIKLSNQTVMFALCLLGVGYTYHPVNQKIPPSKASYKESNLKKIQFEESYSHFNSRECEDQLVDIIPFIHLGSNVGYPNIIGNPSGDVVYYLYLEEFAMINILFSAPTIAPASASIRSPWTIIRSGLFWSR